MDWYYANERDEQVQVSEDELKRLAQSGSLQPDTFIWNESMDDWKAARLVKPQWFLGPGTATGAPTSTPAANPAPSGDIIATPPQYRPPSIPKAAPPTDGTALASLICGIAGLAFVSCYGFGAIFSIAGVVCGHLCRKRLIREGNTSSAGLALAGLITSYIGIAIALIFILIIGGVIALGVAAEAANSATQSQ